MRPRPDPLSRLAVLRHPPGGVVADDSTAEPVPDVPVRHGDSPIQEEPVGGWVPDSSGFGTGSGWVPGWDAVAPDEQTNGWELADGSPPAWADAGVPLGTEQPRRRVGGLALGDSGDRGSADDTDEDSDDLPTGDGVSGRARKVRRGGRTWGRFAELWVPESLRDARVDPGRRGALILLLVAALAASATAVGVWRDQPQARAVDTSVVAALAVSSGSAPQDLSDDAGTTGDGQGDAATDPLGATGAGSPSGAVSDTGPSGTPAGVTPAAATEIVVSVTGLVVTPGLVRLPPGARVADAIAAAGGTAAGAEITGLNLAARVSDGDSIVVGSVPVGTDSVSGVNGGQSSGSAASTGPSAGPPGGLVDLNTADEAALDTLPGVGPVMAQNILAWREANGRFASIEQLQEISGIGPSRYAQIAPLVTVS